MDLIERFRYIMKLNKLTASAFAAQIGVQASSVSHVLSGRNKPSLEFIQKVLLAYPKIDSNWLINGTTKLPSKEIDVENEEGESHSKETVKREKVERVKEETPAILSKVSKEVAKVLIFYTDGTFEEFRSAVNLTS